MAEQPKYIICLRCGASLGERKVKPARRYTEPFVLEAGDYIVHDCALVALSPCWVWRWQRHHGYALVKVAQRSVLFNRGQLGILSKSYREFQTIHACDNPPCVNPAHLRVGTDLENQYDKVNKGRHRANAAKGTRNGRAKLSEGDIPVIRGLLAAGESHRSIARRYGGSSPSITGIATGKKWGWL